MKMTNIQKIRLTLVIVALICLITGVILLIVNKFASLNASSINLASIILTSISLCLILASLILSYIPSKEKEENKK